MTDCPKKYRIGDYEIQAAWWEEDEFTASCLARQHTPPHHRRVLKTVKEQAHQEAWKDLLQRWTKIAREIPGLRRVYDWAIDDETGKGYGVLEAVDSSLQQRLEEILGWGLLQRLHLLAQVAQTLDALHRNDKTYASLTPQRVLLQEEGNTVRVLLAEPGLEHPLAASGTISRALTPHATRPYLSPEEANLQAPTPDADRFAFAALAYHLLTGRPPFGEGHTVYDRLQQQQAPAPPSQAGQERLPAAVDDVFQKALAWDPAGRYPTCQALVDVLRPLMAEAEARKREQTLKQLTQALADQNVVAAEQALKAAKGWVPEDDARLNALREETQRLKTAQKAYIAAREHLQTAREAARDLAAGPLLPDYHGLRAQLAPRTPWEQIRNQARRYRHGLSALLTLAGLFLLGSLFFALTHTTQSSAFQTPAARLAVWTASPTPTFTPTPTLTPTPTFTPTPTLTPTPTFTPTPQWPLTANTPQPPLLPITTERVNRLTLLRTLEGHTRGVYSVAFSPDSAILASASGDRTVRLWRVSDGALLRTLEGHTRGVYSVAFSPDSAILASASGDRTVRLWRVSDGTLLRTLEGHTDYVRSVAFSPDGAILASASDDGTVRLWRVSDGALLRTLEGHTRGVYSVAFSPDGNLLASASGDGTVRLWRVSDGALLRTLEGHSWGANSVAFSPDGAILASADEDHTVRLWRVSDGALLRTLEGHTNWVRSAAFSPDGAILASASGDHTVRLWRVSDGTLLRTLEGHTRWVSNVAFSPDGAILASASDDGTVRLWAVAGGP